MQWHLLGWINRGMIEKARQDLETNIRSSDKSEWTIEAKLTWVTGGTTRRAWRHTFTKSDRRWEGLSTAVNECWPAPLDFDTSQVARGDASPEDALLSVSFNAMRFAEVWRDSRRVLVKIEKNCLCKEKEIGRKTDQSIRGQENVLLSV